MKYFTSEWWESGCEDESVFEKYQEYYLSISPKLPDKLRLFEEKHTLHDSNVKIIQSDFINNEVIINLRGWDNELSQPVNYEIKFIGVMEFKQNLPQEEFVESELGDLGYWEYELIRENIEVRMLFASGAQFNILFNNFDFNAVPIKA